jgi:hypothetical protein
MRFVIHNEDPLSGQDRLIAMENQRRRLNGFSSGGMMTSNAKGATRSTRSMFPSDTLFLRDHRSFRVRNFI